MEYNNPTNIKHQENITKYKHNLVTRILTCTKSTTNLLTQVLISHPTIDIIVVHLMTYKRHQLNHG